MADSFATDEDTAVSGDVLANDTDPDQGDTRTVVSVNGSAAAVGQTMTLASGARLTVNADGTFTYDPTGALDGLRAGQTAVDAFIYVMADGGGLTSSATATVTVTGVNDAPVAVADAYATDEDVTLTVPAAEGVLANDSDVDGDPLSAVVVSGPSHGILTLNADGSFTYTPAGNFNGTDSFTYQANDGTADSPAATVTLTVRPVNDAPVALPDAYATDEDTALTVATPGVLGNDSDVDSDPLSAVVVSDPSHGVLTLNADGSFNYTPAADFNGSDSFTYRARDGALDSNVATVTITVNPVEDRPVAVAGPDQVVNEAALVAFDGSGSFDVDGDTLTYAWNFGDATTGSGSTPTHTYADDGTYIVTLTVDDGHGNSSTDTLTVTVNNVAPTAAVSGPGTGVRGQARSFTFSATDPSPVDQDSTFTYSINWGDGSPLQTVTGGATVQADHVFTANGTYTVAARATDKDGDQGAPASAIVTIKAVEMQGNTLAVGGTLVADTITITPTNGTGNLAVNINGVGQGTFRPTEQILVYGQAGADTIRMQTRRDRGTTTYVDVSAILFGGTGADSVDARGSSADNCAPWAETASTPSGAARGGTCSWVAWGRTCFVGATATTS